MPTHKKATFSLTQHEEEDINLKKANQKVLTNDGIDREDEIPENYDQLLEFREEARKKFDKPILKHFSKDQLLKLPKRLNNSRVVDQESGKKTLDALIPISEDNLILNFLGSGYPLMFEFIKYCIYLLLSIFLTSGSFNFFSNGLLGEFCKEFDPNNPTQEIQCTKDFISMFSSSNKREPRTGINTLQEILNFFTVIVVIFLFQYLRKSIRDINTQVDRTLVNIQDFTVYVTNIPRNFESNNYEQSLQNFFEAIKPDSNRNHIVLYDKFQVTEISLCLDDTLIENLNKEKLDLIKEFKTAHKARIADNGHLMQQEEKNIMRKWGEKENEIDNFSKKLSGGSADNNQLIKENFVGKAFVTFVESEMSDELVDRFNGEGGFLCFGQPEKLEFPQGSGNYVKVISPPHPTDVNWDNLKYSSREKTLRALGSKTMYYLSIFIVFIVILSINKIKVDQKNKIKDLKSSGADSETIESQYMQVFILSQLISIVIIGFNFLLTQFAYPFMAHFLKNSTKTKTLLEVCQYNALGKFINTSIMMFGIQVFLSRFIKGGGIDGFFEVKGGFWGSEAFDKGARSIFGAGGLIYIQHGLILQTILLTIFMTIFDYTYWLMFVGKRKIIEFFRLDLHMTRQEIDNLYKPPLFNMGQVYGGLLQIMFTCCFYAPLLPIGLIYTVIGLGLFYWVIKYTLLRRRSVKDNVSSVIVLEMIELLELLLPMYCAANLLFEFFQSPSSHPSYWSIASIIIGVLHAILPMEKVNVALFEYGDEVPEATDNYYISFQEFTTDYNQENPATAEYYDENMINKMKQDYKQKGQQYERTRKVKTYEDY